MLRRKDLTSNPIDQFRIWFEQARASSITEPNAMTLATVSESGRPSARIVLLKDIREDGFLFYTNYQSRKGKELEANPGASLVFLWKEIERQVRIEGICEKVSPQVSDAYFLSRPEGSRVGAIASPQSEVVTSREALDKLREEALAGSKERPAHWGGYVLKPDMLEFWQGRPDRMHDRFRYKNTTDGWKVDRLAP